MESYLSTLDSCCGNLGGADQGARLNVYRAFPWIGIYLYALLVNGHRKQSQVILAFVSLIVVFYCLYLSAIFIWTALMFYKSIPKGLDENFYGFVAILEFVTLLCIRTRSSIKWFPRFTLLPVMCFLYYVQYTAFGFYNLALYTLITMCLAVLSYHLLAFEIPALSWNPFHHYAPSTDSPRTLYVPIFSLSWYHDLPQLWTMFYPLFGRSTFTEAQLAMVDRNNQLLGETLENAFQNGQNLHQDQEDQAQPNPNPNADQANNAQPPQNHQNEPPSPTSSNVIENQGSATSPLQGRRSSAAGRGARGSAAAGIGIPIGGTIERNEIQATETNASSGGLMVEMNQDIERGDSQRSNTH